MSSILLTRKLHPTFQWLILCARNAFRQTTRSIGLSNVQLCKMYLIEGIGIIAVKKFNVGHGACYVFVLRQPLHQCRIDPSTRNDSLPASPFQRPIPRPPSLCPSSIVQPCRKGFCYISKLTHPPDTAAKRKVLIIRLYACVETPQPI